FTPLLKLTSSEACNKMAYDSLQIHGGTGFMKDFPIERIYRDARITSIYEGTSQLQTIAAIKGVTTGVFIEQIKFYDTQVSDKNCEIRTKLHKMTESYESITNRVIELDNNELLDFHSRRLVEMAGNIIMGYLLVLNSQKNETFSNAARLFVNLVRAENFESYNFIENFEVSELELYRVLKPEDVLEEVS
ncbi:MAG: hypothetical protein KJP14_08270, partial [Eudoraea sp.]|nr:hypothetical protein [Eudoraea sp.]